ncbi:MAG: hypothetical protein RRC07_15885 [Anaerolineae bacterium]|nr:hypothetical protein [Anaerolineae bacterium]
MDGIVKRNDNGARERVAWGVLLVSFAVWLALLIAVPALALRYVERARRPMVLAVQADEGTVGLSDALGRRPAVLAGEPPHFVEGQASILTNAPDTASVQVYTPDESEILARMVLYGATNLEIIQAESPRFRWSSAESELELVLEAGRVRIVLPPRDGRPLRLVVQTPQGGEVLLQQAGQYTVDVSNLETWVDAQEGEAVATSAGATMPLSSGQAAVLRLDSPPQGPMSTSRNLIVNGDFNNGLSGWDAVAWDIQRRDQSEGITSVVDTRGEKVLRFHRVGEGFAGTEVYQPIDQNVVDLESLQLLVTLQITNQSLEVCGQVGSECPLFVVIDYEDVYGSNRSWQQGFYAFGTPIPGYTPDSCLSCGAPLNPHVRVPMHELRSWESDNLLEKLAQENMEPRRIDRLRLRAQGHTFETQVFDVALIVR